MEKISRFFGKIFCIFFVMASVVLMNFGLAYANEQNSDSAARITAEERVKLQKFIIWDTSVPQESISVSVNETNPIIGFLTIIQKVLLQLVLPIVAVGCGLYIAYTLFTADGDESKMSAAWKAILYSIIAIVSIGLSALIVSVISRLNIG